MWGSASSRPGAFEHVLHQDDAAARRIHLLAAARRRSGTRAGRSRSGRSVERGHGGALRAGVDGDRVLHKATASWAGVRSVSRCRGSGRGIERGADAVGECAAAPGAEQRRAGRADEQQAGQAWRAQQRVEPGQRAAAARRSRRRRRPRCSAGGARERRQRRRRARGERDTGPGWRPGAPSQLGAPPQRGLVAAEQRFGRQAERAARRSSRGSSGPRPPRGRAARRRSRSSG